jgi:hypothetical protein
MIAKKQVVTNKDAEDQVKDMDKFKKEISASREKAVKFMRSTGMYDKNGNLKKEYR